MTPGNSGEDAAMSGSAWDETLDLLSIPGALEGVRTEEAMIAAGEAIDAEELRLLIDQRARDEQAST